MDVLESDNSFMKILNKSKIFFLPNSNSNRLLQFDCYLYDTKALNMFYISLHFNALKNTDVSI